MVGDLNKSQTHGALVSTVKGPSHYMLFHTVVEAFARRGDSRELRLSGKIIHKLSCLPLF